MISMCLNNDTNRNTTMNAIASLGIRVGILISIAGSENLGIRIKQITDSIFIHTFFNNFSGLSSSAIDKKSNTIRHEKPNPIIKHGVACIIKEQFMLNKYFKITLTINQ